MDPSALKSDGGPLELTRHWADSFFVGNNWVKCTGKSTKMARYVPENFQVVKDGFLEADQ